MLSRAIPGFLLSGLLACQAPSTETPAASAPAAPADTAAPTAAQSAATKRPPTSPGAYPYTIPPVDETPREPQLRAFVGQVLRACARRDQRALLALVDDHVTVSMGGGIYGKAGFVSDFLNNPGPGSGYARLQQIIRLGGTAKRNPAGGLTATYPYLQDEDRHSQPVRQLDFEPYAIYVGTSPEVAVHTGPSSHSPVVRQLAYPVLVSPAESAIQSGSWLPVLAADISFHGYADARQLYCLADVTLTIEQKNGRLRITSVAPFD